MVFLPNSDLVGYYCCTKVPTSIRRKGRRKKGLRSLLYGRPPKAESWRRPLGVYVSAISVLVCASGTVHWYPSWYIMYARQIVLGSFVRGIKPAASHAWTEIGGRPKTARLKLKLKQTKTNGIRTSSHRKHTAAAVRTPTVRTSSFFLRLGI